MIIVGNVSSKSEAKEIEFIARLFLVGNRARNLARDVFRHPRMELYHSSRRESTSF